MLLLTKKSHNEGTIIEITLHNRTTYFVLYGNWVFFFVCVLQLCLDSKTYDKLKEECCGRHFASMVSVYSYPLEENQY